MFCGMLPAELIEKVLGKNVASLPVRCSAERMQHIEERHPNDVSFILEAIYSGIIQSPDYLGVYDDRYSFVKTLDRTWKNHLNINVNAILIGPARSREFPEYSILSAYGIDSATLSSKIARGSLKRADSILEPNPSQSAHIVDISAPIKQLAAQWGSRAQKRDSRAP